MASVTIGDACGDREFEQNNNVSSDFPRRDVLQKQAGKLVKRKLLAETLHPRAIKQLEAYVNQLVNGFTFTVVKYGPSDNTWTYVYVVPDVAEKIVELLKVNFIGADEIIWLVDRVMHSFDFEDTLNSPGDHPSPEVFGISGIEAIIRKVQERLLSLPWQYEILIPLVGVFLPWLGQSQVRITEEAKILRMPGDTEESGYSVIRTVGSPSAKRKVPPANKFYISLTDYGYGYRDLSSPSFGFTFAKLKIVIAALIACDVLVPDTSFKSHKDTISIIDHDYEALPQDEQGNCYVYPTGEDERPFSLKLPDETWGFISHLSMPPRSYQPSTFEAMLIARQQKTETPTEVCERLQKRIPPLECLFSEFSVGPDHRREEAERLRTALTWFYDGMSNRNKTFSFVQLSIAHEPTQR
jgi:hypothetical protein